MRKSILLMALVLLLASVQAQTISESTLEDKGLQVWTHKEIPCNDGGISLGQALVANAVVK